MDFSKTENFCASKDITNKVERQPTELKNIVVNLMSDKG